MRETISLPIIHGSGETGRKRDTTRPVMLVGFQEQGNLGLGYLASVLRQYGYRVVVVDIDEDPEVILRAAQQEQPLLIGFSLIFQFFIDRYDALLSLMRLHGINCHFTIG